MLTPAPTMKVSTGSSTLARTQHLSRMKRAHRLVGRAGVGEDAVRQDDADSPLGLDPLHGPLHEQPLGGDGGRLLFPRQLPVSVLRPVVGDPPNLLAAAFWVTEKVLRIMSSDTGMSEPNGGFVHQDVHRSRPSVAGGKPMGTPRSLPGRWPLRVMPRESIWKACPAVSVRVIRLITVARRQEGIEVGPEEGCLVRVGGQTPTVVGHLPGEILGVGEGAVRFLLPALPRQLIQGLPEEAPVPHRGRRRSRSASDRGSRRPACHCSASA